MNRKRRTFLQTAGVAVVAPAISKAQPLTGDSERDSVINANLDAVAGHFHNESVNEVEKACALYSDDIV
jgi:hypothetical protein